MPSTHLPLIVRLGGIRALLAFMAVMTAALAAALSPLAAAAWAPLFLPASMVPLLLGGGGIGYYLWRGFTARRLAEEARRHYSQVTYDFETTELQARLIPQGETRGARVMASYRWFRDEYENATRAWQDLGSPRGTQWFEPGVLRRVTELAQRCAALDSTDDVIVGNAAFLTLSSRWERIWQDEQRPVIEDLSLLSNLCQQIDSRGFAPGGTVEAREQVRAHHQRLTEMTAELSEGRLRPSAALDELAWIATDTRRSVSALSLRAAGSGPVVNVVGAGTPRRLNAYGSPSGVGPGRHNGYWYPAGAGATAVGSVVGPGIHAVAHRSPSPGAGFLGDGTFPGV